MLLNTVLTALFKMVAWTVVILCVWWWIGNILLDYDDGPPTYVPGPQPQYVIQPDGRAVLLPPVSVTEAPR
jgi:hypothetical protein